MLNFKKFKQRLPNSPWRLPASPSRGVADFPPRRVSPRIQSQKRNGSKGSVRDLWGIIFCKNPRKSASWPCPFNLQQAVAPDWMGRIDLGGHTYSYHGVFFKGRATSEGMHNTAFLLMNMKGLRGGWFMQTHHQLQCVLFTIIIPTQLHSHLTLQLAHTHAHSITS